MRVGIYIFCFIIAFRAKRVTNFWPLKFNSQEHEKALYTPVINQTFKLYRIIIIGIFLNTPFVPSILTTLLVQPVAL